MVADFVDNIMKGETIGLFFDLLLGLTAISVLLAVVGFIIEKSSYGKRHRIVDLELRPGQLKNELISSWRFVAINTLALTVMIKFGEMDISGQSLFSYFYTFFVHYLLFEVWYYTVHRLMHTRKYFRFHKKHHESVVTTPLTGLSMSAVESLIWAIGYTVFPLLISFVAPVNPLAWLLFIIYHWAGNIIGHINAEIMPPVTATRIGALLVHPFCYHTLHHTRLNGNYSLYAAFLDRIFRTEFADWELQYCNITGRKLANKRT